MEQKTVKYLFVIIFTTIGAADPQGMGANESGLSKCFFWQLVMLNQTNGYGNIYV